MDTRKIHMYEFIVNFFKVTNQTEQSIYLILDAIAPVARKANLMLCDSFDNTLESVVDVVIKYPEYFELSYDANYIKLKYPETLNALVERWRVDENVIAAIQEYMEKYDVPTMYAGVMLDNAEQNERYICSNTKYIDWLWDRLEQNYKPDTRLLMDSCRKTAEDLANIARIPNLYVILSRYYSQNLMNYYGPSKEEAAYVFYYVRNGERRCFKVEKTRVKDIRKEIVSYRVKTYRKVANAPYFPDVALAVPDARVESRKLVLQRLSNLLKKAKNIDLTYDAIEYELDTIYGKIDNPWE